MEPKEYIKKVIDVTCIEADMKKTALLIIDMQKAFVEKDAALCIKGAAATVPAIASLADEMRSAGSKIIWIKRQYAADGSNIELPRKKAFEEMGYCFDCEEDCCTAGEIKDVKPFDVLTPGSTGINSEEDAKGLVSKEGDITIIKPRFSAFFDTNLKEVLEENNVDTLVVCGTTTPNCIRSTVYDAISFNYRVIVPENCCSSNTEEIQRVNMEDMARAGAEIV